LDGNTPTVFSESVYARDSFGWAALRTVRSGSLKFIEAPQPELYDLNKDPRELTNLIKVKSNEVARLRTELMRYAPSANPVVSGDPDKNRQALQSLGYLAPGPHANNHGPAADPKQKLPELLRYEDALNLMSVRSYDAAIATLRSILASDP